MSTLEMKIPLTVKLALESKQYPNKNNDFDYFVVILTKKEESGNISYDMKTFYVSSIYEADKIKEQAKELPNLFKADIYLRTEMDFWYQAHQGVQPTLTG